jgi:hypothetical protein
LLKPGYNIAKRLTKPLNRSGSARAMLGGTSPLNSQQQLISTRQIHCKILKQRISSDQDMAGTAPAQKQKPCYKFKYEAQSFRLPFFTTPPAGPRCFAQASGGLPRPCRPPSPSHARDPFCKYSRATSRAIGDGYGLRCELVVERTTQSSTTGKHGRHGGAATADTSSRRPLAERMQVGVCASLKSMANRNQQVSKSTVTLK